MSTRRHICLLLRNTSSKTIWWVCQFNLPVTMATNNLNDLAELNRDLYRADQQLPQWDCWKYRPPCNLIITSSSTCFKWCPSCYDTPHKCPNSLNCSHIPIWILSTTRSCLFPTLSGRTPVDFTRFHQIPLDSTGLNVWWVTIQSFRTGLDFQSSGVQ